MDRDLADLKLIAGMPGKVLALARDFSHGEFVPPHRHPVGQLLHTLSGVMIARTPGRAWTVPPARALWLPPETTHSFSMRGTVRVRTLYLRPSAELPMPDTPTALKVTPLIRELLLRVLDDDERPDEAVEQLVIPLLLREVAGAVSEPLSLPLPDSRLLVTFADRVLADPADRTPLEEVCAGLGLTLKTFCRRFQRETGMAPDEWRRQARLLEALARLRSGGGITQVAFDLGFASSSSFAAAFRQCFGMTPSQARQQMAPATRRGSGAK